MLSTINSDLISAMKSKDQVKLSALRAIKSEIGILQTSGKVSEVTDADILKIIQKMVKSRSESIDIYKSQNRQDLVDEETSQLDVIKSYLPKQLSEDEVKSIISKIITDVDAKSIKDMGKVMKVAQVELAGKSDSKTISTIVKSLLGCIS